MLFLSEGLILRVELGTLREALQRYRRKVAVKAPSVPVCLGLTKCEEKQLADSDN